MLLFQKVWLVDLAFTKCECKAIFSSSIISEASVGTVLLLRQTRWITSLCAFYNVFVEHDICCSDLLEPVHACLVLRHIGRFLLAVFHLNVTRIGGLMVSLLPSRLVDHGFETRLGQTKYNLKNGICCFSAKYAAWRSKSKDWLAQNYDNLYECSNGMLFQLASIIKIQLSILV